MNGSPSPGEVLRGIRVEPELLRVGRMAVVPSGVDEPSRNLVQEELLQSIEADRRAARAAGEQAGYAEGLRRGRSDAAAEAGKALQKSMAEARAALAAQQERVASLIGSLEHARGELLRIAEDDMVALCFETVCRIVGEKAVDAAAVRSQVLRTATQCADDPLAVLLVHPEDLESMRGATALRCEADAGVALGGCIVRRAGNSLDARVETALVACRDSLLATRARRAGAGERA